MDESKKIANQQLNVREYVEQMSLLLNLQIADDYLDQVVANFQSIQSIAELVNNFPLSEEIEIATIFEP